MDSAQDTIRCFTVGPIQTNCYAYVSQGSCLVVDPGSAGADIARELADVEVCAIVATHGHSDHIGGVSALKRACGAPFMIGKADAYRIELGLTEGSIDTSAGDRDAPEPDRLLVEGDVLELGSAAFRIIETPGHTQGGICLIGQGSAEGIAFTGDTLFAGSAGRTDLSGGDFSQLMASLSRIAEELDADCTVLSGHGPATTMGAELASNRFYTTRFDVDPRRL